jgi:hypothetical protein
MISLTYLYYNKFHTNQYNKNNHMDQVNRLINLCNNRHHQNKHNHKFVRNNQVDKLHLNKIKRFILFKFSSTYYIDIHLHNIPVHKYIDLYMDDILPDNDIDYHLSNNKHHVLFFSSNEISFTQLIINISCLMPGHSSILEC